ncbi:MAG: acyltransferase [Kocuria sp.]|nr:acyltransferase [Kocuria sp.]
MPETTATRSNATDVRPDVVSRYSGFRKEVQGLRAVAVLLVVIYHVFLGRVSGGVDIFLLISAFFMTLSFVRKIESGRPLAIGRYWLHTFKRLLPLATVVILVTIGLLTEFPESSIAQFRWEALASVFYVENWALAAASVDYYAADHSTASPFQHFWSLSVQGQVFLLWPLIFGFAWLVRRRTRISSVPILAGCFALIFVASMTYSVITTETQQAFAYFDTRARLWEFALGSLIALAIPYLNPPRVIRIILGWVGIVSMVLVGVLVDVQGAFPGWIALWPLLSAAAIIVAGNTESPFGFDRFLSWWPTVKLGDAAYALYLVHWPLLITYLVMMDRPWAGPRSGVAIVIVSIILALVLTAFIEDPIKAWKWPERAKRRLAIVIVTCLALVSAVVLTWTGVDSYRTAQLEAEAERNNPGAMSLMGDYQPDADPEAPTLPLASDLGNQWVGLPEECTGIFEADNATVQDFCRQTEDVQDPTKTVVVVGNSHMEQYMGAVIPIAEEENWQMVSLLQPGCGLGLEGQSDVCREGNQAALDYVEKLKPDVVLTTSTRGELMDGSQENVIAGLPAVIEDLTEEGIRVVGFRDHARLDFNPYTCVESKGADDPSCTVPASQVLAPSNPAQELESIENYQNVDLNDLICPDGQCRPVIGNVHVWLDSHHLTWDYTETMTRPAYDRLYNAIAQ